MGLFQQKTEEQKQAEQQARAEAEKAEQEARAQAQQAREAQRARERYLASPVGRAEAAYAAGQMFFQFTTDISKIQGQASDWTYSQSTTVTRSHATDVLGQIEEQGWRLENVGYVFVETGVDERSKVLSSGSVSRTQGYVEGIYLFRRVKAAAS